MRALILAAALAAPVCASADSIVAAVHLRAGTVIAPEHLAYADDIAGAISEPGDALGLETRIAIYQGRAIRLEDLRSPTLVERNQIVQLRFQTGGLSITTEARSLGRGSAGETVRVMNISSRTTISAMIQPDGTLIAAP
ncbi:MAG: flagellar basal body P-ring formation chaperone FlgA [Paracoccus sp. (in: a-proteobacteria)]|nr:flagellar basal body P-ring formation chaperone FlgA [Paracoccus sp. (in: a-proteobacteria)]